MCLCVSPYLAPCPDSPWDLSLPGQMGPSVSPWCLLSKLSLVLTGHSEGISHCVLDSAQSAALDLPEGRLFAAASATGPSCGRAFFPWSLECSFVWPNHFLAEHSAVLVKAAIVNTEGRQVDRISINVKLQKPLNPSETQWLFLYFSQGPLQGLFNFPAVDVKEKIE